MKWDILKKGLQLNIDYSRTWSCYKGQLRPCLKCGTCVERTESFYRNKTKDPTLTNNEWKKAVKYMEEVLIQHEQKII